jgi:hypothetical protein
MQALGLPYASKIPVFFVDYGLYSSVFSEIEFRGLQEIFE